MATSGTWAFNLDLLQAIEEAYEQAGLEPRSGYDIRTARRSLNLLMLEWQTRGLHLWTVKSASQTLTADVASYTLSAEKLDIVEGLLRQNAGDPANQTDLHMERASVSDYAHETNKLQTGRPLQYFVQRAPTGITVTVWPVPDTSGYTFFYYYLEQVEDTGRTGTNNMDVPSRFLPALTTGLAWKIAIKKNPEKAAGLQAEHERLLTLAMESHREKTTMLIHPGGYC